MEVKAETGETQTSVDISWKPGSEADYYKVTIYSDYAKNNPAATANVDKQGNESRSITANGEYLGWHFDGLTANTTYFYEIAGMTQTGTEVSNYNSNFTTSEKTSGVESTISRPADAMTVYQSGSSIIVSNTETGSDISVIGVNGQVLKQLLSNGETTAIDASGLSAGFYIVKSGNQVEKIALK